MKLHLWFVYLICIFIYICLVIIFIITKKTSLYKRMSLSWLHIFLLHTEKSKLRKTTGDVCFPNSSYPRLCSAILELNIGHWFYIRLFVRSGFAFQQFYNVVTQVFNEYERFSLDDRLLLCSSVKDGCHIQAMM